MVCPIHSGKRITYVAIVSGIPYVLKIVGISAVAYYCHLLYDSVNIVLFMVTVLVLSMQKSYLFYTVIIEKNLVAFTWQICCLIEIILTLQFAVSVLLNHRWFPCIPKATSSSIFVFLVVDSIVFSYFAFCLARPKTENESNHPSEQSTEGLMRSGSQETHSLQGGEDQTPQNANMIGKQLV